MEAHNTNTHILTVNAGSSSIKIAVFTARGHEVTQVAAAAIQNIGLPQATITTPEGTEHVAAADHAAATKLLMQWLAAQVGLAHVAAVGHRIVHGGPHHQATCRATDAIVADLHKIAAFDPEHLPNQLSIVNLLKRILPNAHHVLCFDTTFHKDLPVQAQLLPLPRRFAKEGVRRYGFHGLSYAYILDELRRVEGDAAARGKVVVAHLGSGVSLAALAGGKPIDTTMGMTPASGIPMSTRAGDLDPGLVLYLAKVHGYNAERFNKLVNFESGLLGMSETTADMEKLLQIEAEDPRAKDAVDVFCYHVKKTIGSFAAALGGLNTLVFTGGMGENAPKIRARVCDGLEFLGVTLDAARNKAAARLISADGSAVGVHVIHTDEAVTIARDTVRLLNKK